MMVKLIEIPPKRVEIHKYKSSSTYIHVYDCLECGEHEIRPERRRIKRHSGKYIFCVHKGVPFKSAYNHLKDGVLLLDKLRNGKFKYE